MIVYSKSRRQREKNIVFGRGLVDSFGKISNFLLQNKDTISTAANLVKDVSSSAASTANAIQQIKQAIKGKGIQLTKENKNILNKLSKKNGA